MSGSVQIEYFWCMLERLSIRSWVTYIPIAPYFNSAWKLCMWDRIKNAINNEIMSPADRIWCDHSVQRGLKPTLLSFIPPCISNHTFHKNKHTHPFADHVKSYGGIKVVWIWRISTWLKLFKGCRMGRSDKVSLWYVALLINIRFRIFILE